MRLLERSGTARTGNAPGGFYAEKVHVSDGYSLEVSPLSAGEAKKETTEGKKDEKNGREEAPEEMVLSHFDFENIDPERNCLLKSNFQSLAKVRLKSMREAAIKYLMDLFKIKNLSDFPYFGESYGLRDFLVNEGVFKGRIKSADDQLDLLTADILVLKKSFEHGILTVDKDNRIQWSPGRSLVFYMRDDRGAFACRQFAAGPLEMLDPHY